MKKCSFVIAWLMAMLMTPVAQGQEITQEWVKEHYVKSEHMVRMRDGVRLSTTVYAPRDNSRKHPIIMERTPYGCNPYGDEMRNLTGIGWRLYVQNGYILVFQDVRGRNHSEGTYEDIRPFIENKKKKQVDEASDTYDTADWLVKNTHNNGCIGVMGISYPGFYSTMAGLSGHPAIKAVSPQAPVTDWFRGDDDHHNGAFFQMMFQFSYWFQYLNCSHPSTGENPTHFIGTDVYSDMLRMGALSNITPLLGDSVDMWNNTINHPNLDEWWNARDVSLHCHDVKPAVMVVGGLFDAEDCYGALRTYRAIREQSPTTPIILIEGPWSHGAWSSGAESFFGDIYVGDSTVSEWYNRNIEYPFFAYYLEGKGEAPKGAMVYHTGENRWEQIDEGWNVSDADAQLAYYLQPNGGLSSNKSSQDVVASYPSDPNHPVPCTAKPCRDVPRTYMIEDQRFAATRPDVATFSTPVLTDTLRVAGPVVADLMVSMDATDADFIVKVIDVFPENYSYPDSLGGADMSGYQMLVRAEVMRGRFRNSMSNPEPFQPGEPTQVCYTLPDIAHTWLPGHRLMVQVQSSWFPLVDRNPQQYCDNIYRCTDADFRPCTVTLHAPSRILLTPAK